MTKEIKKTLIDQDLSIAVLAKRIGRSRTWTSLVINGHMRAPETRALIAKALHKRVKDLWPDDDNGDNCHERRAA